MKFMKLGSKQNTFQTQGNITSVASELSSDITFNVNGHKFELHKFPFLSKCGCVSKLLAEAHNTNSDDEEVVILDFPGGAESFEMCAKFCYGITFTLSAHNVVEVLCGAKYLEMTEDIEKGNLIFKLEVFLNSSILRGWKDSIICLQSCNAHMPRAEDLKVVGRCIDSISSKTMVEPSKVDWSFTYTRSSSTAMSEHSSSNMSSSHWMSPVPRDWWVEDICGLDVELYWRLMVAVKAKGMPQEQIGESLRVYTLRWLPGVSKEQQLLLDGGVRMGNGGGGGFSTDHAETATKHRELLETIVSLLPSEKGSSSCSFLLKLLKAATILSASPTAKMELVRRIGLQLEDASLRDLLIPSLSYSSDSLYDVDLVQHIVEQYLASEKSPTTSPSNNGGAWRSQSMDRHRTQSIENCNFSERSSFTGHSSQLKVAKLIDSYLAEIARDTNLPLSKFVQLAESVPDFARPVHDKLYHAIDMYLQEHPGLSKSERKRICGLMDCKKLSMEACMHAATNDRLPLRIVVQVLFFEQVRTAMRGGLLQDNLPSNIRALLPPDSSGEISLPELMKGTMITSSMAVPEEGWDAVHQDYASLKGDLATMRCHIAEAENERNMMQHELAKQQQQQQQKAKASFLTSFKPRKIFNKIFSSKGFSSSQSSNLSESPVQTTGKELTRQHRNSVG